MERRRIGGALITACTTGVGIMVPYTVRQMPPLAMALIWAVLVFAGIVGLAMALYPGSSEPETQGRRIPVRQPEGPMGLLLSLFGTMGLLIAAPLAMMIIFFGAIKLLMLITS